MGDLDADGAADVLAQIAIATFEAGQAAPAAPPAAETAEVIAVVPPAEETAQVAVVAPPAGKLLTPPFEETAMQGEGSVNSALVQDESGVPRRKKKVGTAVTMKEDAITYAITAREDMVARDDKDMVKAPLEKEAKQKKDMVKDPSANSAKSGTASGVSKKPSGKTDMGRGISENTKATGSGKAKAKSKSTASGKAKAKMKTIKSGKTGILNIGARKVESEDYVETWEAISRPPSIGEQILGSGPMRFGAWTLADGEYAIVVAVNPDGDFKLKNAAGTISDWQHRDYYLYLEKEYRNPNIRGASD